MGISLSFLHPYEKLLFCCYIQKSPISQAQELAWTQLRCDCPPLVCGQGSPEGYIKLSSCLGLCPEDIDSRGSQWKTAWGGGLMFGAGPVSHLLGISQVERGK